MYIQRAWIQKTKQKQTSATFIQTELKENFITQSLSETRLQFFSVRLNGRWMDDLQFYIFNSISVISEQWESDNEDWV